MSETTMPSDLRAHREATVRVFAGIDVEGLDGRQAQRALREVAAIKHAAASLEGVLARRVDETNIWVRGGHRSAAHAVAALTGTSVGQATGTMQTAQRLEHLSDTAEAFAKGRLSPAQAAEIAHAASEVPDAEDELLRKARDERFSVFRDRCRRVAASAQDPLERAKRIHANRSCRTWTDAEGAWNLSARGTATDGGRIMAALGAAADQVFKAARARGDREPLDAYRFDALRDLATRGGSEGSAQSSGPKAHVHVNVDAEALLSLQALPGATCEIPGVGVIPVEDARALLGDAGCLERRVDGGCGEDVAPGAGRDPGRRPDRAQRGSRGSTRGRRPSAAPGPPAAKPPSPPSTASRRSVAGTTTSSPTAATPSNPSATANTASSHPPTPTPTPILATPNADPPDHRRIVHAGSRCSARKRSMNPGGVGGRHVTTASTRSRGHDAIIALTARWQRAVSTSSGGDAAPAPQSWSWSWWWSWRWSSSWMGPDAVPRRLQPSRTLRARG